MDGYNVHRENITNELFCSEPDNRILCVPMYGFAWKSMQMSKGNKVFFSRSLQNTN